MALLFLALMLVAPALSAEPWLGIRFAQNCAGCHAPGRINLKPMDRRCSLSCQGCHVNPSGGGLRSFYGKWNEDRWLRSFVISALKPRSSFAPVSSQKYHKPAKQIKKSLSSFIQHTGYPLVKGKQELMLDEKPYARDGLEFITTKDDLQFLYQIPQEDPYRLHAESKIDGGADLRYQYLRYLSESDKERFKQRKKTLSFLMNADLALRWRPLHRNLHLVYETRFLGFPHQKKVAEVIDQSLTRSLYVMVDNLPYNVYVMYGLYRPLFGGNPMPDHRALPQLLTARALDANSAYVLQYRTLSIGTAPNVPYANLHLITGKNRSFIYSDEDSTKGVVLNVGLRFVTLGINTTYSFWFTNDDTDTKSVLHSASFGMQLARTTVIFEALRLRKSTARRDDTGSVLSLDTHTQLWRQIYLTAQYAWANVSKNLRAGSSQQYRIGLRSFLLPGIDLSLSYEYDIDDRNGEDADKISALSSQLHISI